MIEVCELRGEVDIQDLLDLQDRVIARHGPDRIWVHDRAGFEALFGLGDDFLALGVRGETGLLAASLSRRTRPGELAPLVPGLPWSDAEGSHIGLNTLSLPGRSASPQMIRLLHARRARLAERGIHHLFGGIDPEHSVSLGCAFHAGAVGVGHLLAGGSVELLLWHGPGLEGFAPQVRDRSDIRDPARQASLMRAGLVATGLDRSDRSTILFAPLAPQRNAQ